MIRSKRVQIVFILVFFFIAFVFGQDKQDEQDKQLREEIISIYLSKGEQGLLDFVRKQKDKISNKFIVDFAKAGVKERKEEWLKICEIMAEEKKNEKSLADVLCKNGDYFWLVSDNKKAAGYFDKALPLYQKINDPGGQGNVYLSKGLIYSDAGDYVRALEMYGKALSFFEKAKELGGQGSVYMNEGDIYSYTGDNSRALEKYDKALILFEKAKDPQCQGNVYMSEGDIYSYTGDNSRALEKYDKALPFFEKSRDPQGQGNVYMSKGNIYLYTGDNSKALEMYDKALPFFEKSRDPQGQGNVYLGKGDIYLYTGDNSSALAMYHKALPLYENAGELLGQGNIYQRRGDIFLRIGENLAAFEMYDKSLSFFEKARSPIGQGNVYLKKGNICYYTGDNSSALEKYDKALLFYEKAEEPLGQGNIYRRKGDVYLRIGEISTAFEMYNHALPFYEKAEHPIGQGNVYWGKGETYLRIGDYSKTIEMYDKALLFFKKAREPIGQANVYKGKGDIYLRTGDYAKALEMCDKALLLFKKGGDVIGQGNVYRKRGDIYLYAAYNSKALEMYDKALLFFEKAGEPVGQGNIFKGKGDIYLRIEENSKSLEMYSKALHFYRNAGVIEAESIALHGQAKVLVKLGKKNKALELFEKGLVNLEKVRAQTAFSEMKRTFMEKVYEQYEETVLFMLENKYYDKGFKYAEAMRARVFLDRMAEGLVRMDKGLAPDLKEKRDNLVTKLSLLSKEMHQTAGKKDKKKLQDLKKQYRKVENDFEDLLVKVRLDNPLYAWVRYPEPVSVQHLQTEVLKKGELLLRYFITSNRLYVFVISKESFKVVPVAVKENEMKSIVERYLKAVGENNSRSIKTYGQALYRKFFKPLVTEIKEGTEIIFIPDGELVKIPFESLIMDMKELALPVFLLEEYHIKYIQSASILSIMRKYYRDRDTKSFIGFGDPVYDYENFKKGKPEQGTLTRSSKQEDEIKEIHRSRYARACGILNRLPRSGEEVTAIARLFEKKSQKCAIHIREQATEGNAKTADMRNFDFIHFASHGLLNDDFQSLVLSQDIPGEKDDGYFTLNEIMNCDYDAKLVVLSACQTGSGKMERAEGVTGLTRAVMYAGTPAVVASLWKVDDTATKELMIHFYRNMLEKNMDKVEALRQAKLELIKNKKYSSPLFWSAFIMYGE